MRIGAQRWRLRRGSLIELGDVYGVTVERELRITLSDRQAAAQLRETVLHELLHAIWSKVPLDQDDAEQERIIGSLSPWLLGVLRDNPELVAFLLAGK